MPCVCYLRRRVGVACVGIRDVGQTVWTNCDLEEIEQDTRAGGAEQAEITDRAEMCDVIARLRHCEGGLARVGVERLRKFHGPVQVTRVWITEIICLVEDDIDAARITPSNPWHLGRTRTRADLERAVEVFAAVVRSGKPDGVLIGAGIVHCPDGVKIAG